jgi:hypothetical protein
MGGVVKKAKKIVKKVTKPITKIVKKTVKKVKKIGKAVMKGVSKITNKLGPVGMIALSIAMPYALAGLSTATTAAMSSSNVFLRAVGTVGNQIRLGYQAFNTGMSIAKKSITDVIGKTFQKFAPKGGTNIFSRISDGAKRLYNATKEKLKSVSPKFKTAKTGQSEVFGLGQAAEGPMLMDNTLVADKLKSGVLEAGQVNMKSLTESGGWFTRTNAAGVQADTIVSDVINDAYKTRLDGFGTNAKRMFTDIKNKALEMDTYINDEQIGSFVESNKAATSYRNDIMEYAGDMDYTGSQKFQIKTEIPDLAQTGDYTLGTARDRVAGTYNFTGNETFGKQPATKNFFQKNAKKLKDLTKSILAPSGDAPQAQGDIPLTLDTSKIDMAMSTYSGTDQEGSQGGSLVAKVYGQDAANRLLSYHQNMNLLNSGESYYTS